MKKSTLTLLGCLLPGVAFAQSGIVSDDFSGATLGSQWTHVDPLGDTSMALEGFGSMDAQLVLALPEGQDHDLWTGANHAPRLLQNCNDTDFEVEVKFDSEITQSWISQGIVVQESMGNLLRFEFLHTPQGDFLFSATAGDAPSAALVQDTLSGSPSYLRVNRTGDDFCVQYSFDGAAWANCAMFSYALNVTQVGVHATSVNFMGPAHAFESRVDYFFETASRIEPEDGVTDSEAPVANAGPALAIHAGTIVNLDGSGSTDDVTPTAALVFDWSLIGAPAGSAALLTDQGSVSPSFFADLPGVYTVQLIVTDGAGFASDPVVVEISSENLPPTADAGSDELVSVGGNAVLDGLDSYDPDGDDIDFNWMFTSIPAGSSVVLLGADTATPSFSPDLAGDYALSLVTSDAFADSDSDEVVVTAIEGNGIAIDTLRDLAGGLRWEPSSKFRHWGHKHWVRKQVRRAARDIERNRLGYAEWRLSRVLKRTDGCVLRGAPDAFGPWCSTNRPDVVTDCDLQHEIYDSITIALDIIGAGN